MNPAQQVAPAIVGGQEANHPHSQRASEVSATNEHSHGSDLPMVNRSALVLEATQVYVDWANNCPGGGPKLVLSEMRDDESSVYLIPEMDFGPEDWLRKNYLAIFEEELHAWHTDETDWPKDCSFKAFQRFFTVSFHSMVVDMGDELLARDSG